MLKTLVWLVCTATNVEHDKGFYSATAGSFTDCVRLRLLRCSSDFTTSTLLSTRTSTLRGRSEHGFRERDYSATQARARAEMRVQRETQMDQEDFLEQA